MAVTECNYFEMSGGDTYEYISNISIPANGVPSPIQTTKRAKRIILGGGYSTSDAYIVMAEDGDNNVYSNGSVHANLRISSWTDNSISFSGYFSSSFTYKLNGYIVY